MTKKYNEVRPMRLSYKTWRRLNGYKTSGESWDKVINNILNELEKNYD